MTEQQQERGPVLTGRSETIGELVKALAVVQTAAVVVQANETAEVRGTTKGGKDYKYDYSYADLPDVTEAILPKLGENGLVFVAWPMYTPRGFALVFQLAHESGEWIGGEWTLPSADPQTVGSEITYARRYCLQALTGVAAKGRPGSAPTDDDGRLASAGYDYGDRRGSGDDRPASVPEGWKDERHAALGYLRSVVQQKGLDESLVPQAFEDRAGAALGQADIAQIQAYTDFVQRTGMLAEPENAPASWGGPPTGDTAEAVQDAASAAADQPRGGDQ